MRRTMGSENEQQQAPAAASGEAQQPEPQLSDVEKLTAINFWLGKQLGEMTATLVAGSQVQRQYAEALVGHAEVLGELGHTLKRVAEEMSRHSASMDRLFTALRELKPQDLLGSMGSMVQH